MYALFFLSPLLCENIRCEDYRNAGENAVKNFPVTHQLLLLGDFRAGIMTAKTAAIFQSQSQPKKETSPLRTHNFHKGTNNTLNQKY